MGITVLHHADADGFGAAWALWKGLNGGADFIPVRYGEPVPEIPGGTDLLLIVDFSYDRMTCEALAERYRLVVIDHHKTAEEELRGLPYAIFDQGMSGAMLAWRYIFPFVPAPELIRYVQDRDLWRFALPHSEEVNLYIASLPWNFEIWDRFDLDTAILAGTALRGFRDRQIAEVLGDARVRVREFEGHRIPVVNCTANVSEVGQELLKRYPESPFAVMYYDLADGRRNFSLRSRGDVDVAELCRRWGGGGHANAAGFVAAVMI